MKKIFLALTILFWGSPAISQNPLLLKDIYPGITGSGIQQIVKTSNYTFFNAEDDDPDADRGLYRTDGTPGGTIKLNLTYPTYISTKAEKLTPLGNKIVFAGDNSPNYGEIWASDGTQAGTIAIERFQPTTPNTIPIKELNAMGSYAYYSAVNNSNQAILKRTDGTVAGTSEVYNFGTYTGIPQLVFLTPLNNILYFILYDQYGTGVDQLWRSDGTTAGTYIVHDFGFTQYVASYIMPAGNNLYIMTVVPGTGNVLFKSDGTAAGSMNVKTISSTGNNNYPAFAAIGSTFYFAGLDGNGRELWKSDGTAAGTVMAADIYAGAGSSSPVFMTAFNNNLYFAATTLAEGNELWKYDGNTASLIKDINPGTANGAPGSFVVSNNSMMFRATTPASGFELWITDGTASNTVQAADINPGANSSGPNLLTPGNQVYFTAGNGMSGPELFVYDNVAGLEGLHKIYVNDNSTSGDVFTTAVGNNSNTGTKAAPVATISHALTIAAAGDTIVVDAGTYTEQVTIDKGITIKGAGPSLTGILKPAVTYPPPGPFTEQGVIQTAQNIGDVHIKDISITGDYIVNVTPIIIQGGGSVKNCNLQNGNQGIFFRVESATKTAVIENNIINAEYIGVNCAGTGLSASLLNNTISASNTGFSAGVFAGLDFGSLPQLTISGNFISSYATYAIFASSVSSSIINNSLTGNGIAFQQFGNALNATCNWYGTKDAELIRAKMNGNINYAPWLVNGIDNDPVAPGFQPAPGTCTGRQNRFYVNNNSQAGDVFTTTVGNNANNGFSTAPFATINHAISVAQAGDTIVVDAGTYVEHVVVNKSLILRGAKYGQQPGNLTDRGNESIVMPAIANTTIAGAIIYPGADYITIDGFLLDGDNPAISGGVNVNGADANIGCGIYNNGVIASYLTVKNNIVKNVSVYGIGLFRSFGNTTGPAMPGAGILQNRVDNSGSRGIVLAYNAYGNIVNNHISRCNSSGTWFSQQYVPNLNNAASVVGGNIIDQCNLGMQSSSIQTNASAVLYLNNEITGLSNATSYGLSLLAGNSSGLQVSNNKIQNVSVGVYINSSNPVNPILVNYNSILASLKAVQSFNANPVNATCNWFGIAGVEAIASKIDGASINYTPWLINGTDNNAAIGFQPVANACLGQPRYYVNDNSLTGDVFTTAVGSNSNNGSASSPFATPDYAYSIAQPGDTIYVDAGTYDLGGLTYSFPKPVIFLGTNYQVSPNDPSNKLLANAARNAESIFTNGKMSIASSGISIEGFTWDVGNRTGVELVNTAATNNDFGTFKFTKNIFKITHTNANQNSFSITGKFVATPNMPVTSGYTIEDNRFEKSGSATGNTLNFNYVKNIAITDNSFVVTGTTFRTQQAANLGGSGITDGVVFSNNTLDEISTAVGGNRIAGALISGNKMHNINNAFANTNSMPESSNIEFSNNELGNDLGTPFMLYNRTGAGTLNILKVENNVITGVSTAAVNQLFGTMNFTFSNTALNPSFIIRGNKITYSGDFSSVGSQFFRPITVRGNIANVLLENNELTLNNTGSLGAEDPATLLPANSAFSIITDHGATSFMPSNAVINVLNNKIHGFKQSVVFYDVTATGRDAYTGYGNIPAGATINVNNNSFTNDSISINNGPVGQTVNATCNWYGSSAAQNVLPKISATTVNYIPWLVNGTDNDPATGFQPLTGSCNGTIPTLSFDTSTNVSCFGGNNGTISITVNGGSAPYNFNWSRNGTAGYSTVEDPLNLIAGTYDLAMTDANGSTASLTGILISEPVLLTATATGTSTSCFNSATVVAAGGTAPYTYLWSNGATTATVINIPAGTYSVIVTDIKGCTATANVTVTASEAFNPSASVSDVTCFGGSNGTITVTNVNSTAPFEFSIDGINFQPGNLPYSFNNLAAGTYTIAVRDGNGCIGFVTKTINQPVLLVVTLNNTQRTCFGQSTGAISVIISGGSGALSYSWSGPNGYTSTQRNISNLATGSYSFTVTDNNGCSANLNVAVTSFNEITVAAAITNVLCRGGSTGAIDLTISGGSNSGFTFAWTGGSTASSEDLFNLGSGNYNVAITDIGSGCVVTRSYTITQPASNLSLATVKTNATACNSLGTITATGSGGTSPYQYRLDNGNLQSSGLFTNLYGGTYTVWVQDANGCTTSKEVIITDNGSDQYESNNSKNQARLISISSAVNARIATAADIADWFKFVTPAGGGNFILSFTHPSAAFTYNMYAGGNNTPALVPVNTTATTKEYVLSGNTTYYISVTGGTSYVCYELKVSPPLSFGETITVTPNGKDAIIEKAKPVVTVITGLSAKAYPNPHQGSFNLSIESPETGTARIELFSVTGQKLQEKTVSVQKGNANIVPLQVTQNGTVIYRVQIGKYVVNEKVIGAN